MDRRLVYSTVPAVKHVSPQLRDTAAQGLDVLAPASGNLAGFS